MKNQIKQNFNLTTYEWNNSEFILREKEEQSITILPSENEYLACKRVYIHLDKPSELNRLAMEKAELILTQKESNIVGDIAPKLALYFTDLSWDVNYCCPLLYDAPIAWAKVKTENNTAVTYSFDITSVFEDMEKLGLDYYHLALVLFDEENLAVGNSVTIYGSSVSDDAFAPKLQISFAEDYATPPESPVHTFSLGRSVEGHVNLYNGGLSLTFEDFSLGGNRMPVTIRHLYSHALRDRFYTYCEEKNLRVADFSAMKLGYGYRLNYMQSMIPSEILRDGTVVSGFIYTNETGETVYFVPDTENAAIFVSDDDTQMQYFSETRVLEADNERYFFDEAGRLVQIVDDFENALCIAYTDGRITSITDGADRSFAFAYDGDFLHTITAPDGTVVRYAYTNNMLSGVFYPASGYMNFYADDTMYGVYNFTETDAHDHSVVYDFENGRVTALREINRDGMLGNKIEFKYSPAAKRTVVSVCEQKDDESGEIDNKINTVYLFDSEGCESDRYSFLEDADHTDEWHPGNSMYPYHENGEKTFGRSHNLLSSHALQSAEGWTVTETPADGFETRANVARTEFGSGALCLSSASEQTLSAGIDQSCALEAGEYTFSAYILVNDSFVGAEEPGAYLRVTAEDGTILSESEHLATKEEDFVRLSAPFTLTDATSVRVQILVNGAGSASVNAAQLEDNPYVSPYNMLENGSFEQGMTKWKYSNHVYVSRYDGFFKEKALCASGVIGSKEGVSQNVSVRSERSTRETFTLSGWAKGKGLPKNEEDSEEMPVFRLRAILHYLPEEGEDEGETEEFFSSFAPVSTDWQYATVEFAKSKYKALGSVTVCCDYDYNVEYAFFDDIQLVRSGIETGLTQADFLNEDMTSDESESGNDEGFDAPTFEEWKDERGNALTETTFTDGALGTLYRAFGYNATKNDLVLEVDTRGGETHYTVNEANSRVEEVTDRCGSKTAYAYDALGRTTRVVSKNSDGALLAQVNYEYDILDNLTTITRGDGLSYVLSYNAYHHLESIGLDGKPEALVAYAYKRGSEKLKTVTYANGDKMSMTYNSKGELVGETWTDAAGTTAARYRYVYDDAGNLVRSLDFVGEKEYNYTYKDNTLVRATEASVTFTNDIVTQRTPLSVVSYHYDSEGRLKRKVITPTGGDALTLYFETVDDKTVVKYTAGGKTVTVHSGTDSFGRKTFDEIQTGAGFLTREFDYLAGEVTEEHLAHDKLKSSPTTQLVSRIVFSDGREIEYEYDAEERITKVTDSVDGVTEYTYDALGQLLTERVNGIVVNSMTYDGYGNILSKNGKLYAYDSVWKDLLLSVDSTPITYDAQGNPTSYLGHALTWEKGRQLKSFDGNSYTYNANGIRTSKTVGGIKHEYTLDGTKILRETWGENVLIPLYDNEDSVCGIEYNGTAYFFRKNLQGDVIAIANASGTTVATYSYDAWGVCTILSDSTGIIASVNPFRYRSYYYDSEIAMYYLQSRYYNPAVGRFVNGDTTTYLDSFSAPNSSNLFSYCFNDSINKGDPDGDAPFLGWGLQLEGSFMGLSGGIELIWFKNIAKSMYGNRNLPCVYCYGGLSYNFKGENAWNIKSLISFVKDEALRAFSSKRKAAWKIGGGLSLCAFMIYGKITSPEGYKGPFITVGGTLFHVKAYVSTAPNGSVRSYGIGVSSSKFGFSPISASYYFLIPGKVIISIASWFSSLFNKVKTIAALA